MIVKEIIGWLIPFVLGSAISVVGMWAMFFRSFRDGLQCLLRAEIIRENELWVTRGFCPVYAKESLRRIYKAYHALKGNDVATELYNDVIHLPERKENNHED